MCFWCFRKFFRTQLSIGTPVSCRVGSSLFLLTTLTLRCRVMPNVRTEWNLLFVSPPPEHNASSPTQKWSNKVFYSPFFLMMVGHFRCRRRRNVLNFFTRTAKNFSRSFGRRRHHHQNRASKSQINQGGKFHPLPRRTSIFILLQYLRTHDDDVIFLGAAACLGILSSLPALIVGL